MSKVFRRAFIILGLLSAFALSGCLVHGHGRGHHHHGSHGKKKGHHKPAKHHRR